jgi:hypothetical protein
MNEPGGRGTLDEAETVPELVGKVFSCEGHRVVVGGGVAAAVLEAAFKLDGLGGSAEPEEGNEHSDTNRIH